MKLKEKTGREKWGSNDLATSTCCRRTRWRGNKKTRLKKPNLTCHREVLLCLVFVRSSLVEKSWYFFYYGKSQFRLFFFFLFFTLSFQFICHYCIYLHSVLSKSQILLPSNFSFVFRKQVPSFRFGIFNSFCVVLLH